jgi:hypothetical protein
MIQEAISPTRERLLKGDRIEAPEYSPTVDRRAYRALHKIEELFRDGKINEGCRDAGMKLMRHNQGLHGHDIRLTVYDSVGGDSDPHGLRQPGPIYHGQKVAEAREHILSRNTKTAYATWMALLGLVEETKTLEDIGAMWGHKNAAQARAAGLTVISFALEDISVLWGFSQSYHSRQPPQR